jgi:aryl-alcohol dehydrogenase-like predicted oxidoreductase
MRKRRFGRCDFEVSELALGTWGLSGDAYGPVYHKEVDRVIDRALELGITLFETADVYGDGKMETKLGERLDAAGDPEDDAERPRIVTKIGSFTDADPPQKKFDADSLRVAFEKSRERIGRDIDVVLLHCPSVTVLYKDETTAMLKEKSKSGELAAWGVSAGDWEAAEAAVAVGAEVVQLPYNALHSRDLHRISDRIAETDTAVLARSVLAHGLLAGHWQQHKTFFDNDHRSKRWTKETLPFRIGQLEAIRSLISEDVITLRAAALRYVLSNAMVSSSVLGPRSVTQLNQLVREAGEEPPYLDDEALMELPSRLERVGIEV